MNRFQVLAASAAVTLLLIGCGGGGGSDATAPQPPSQAIPSLQLVGASADANTVNAPVCADPYAVATVGAAAKVRYPASRGAFRGWPSLSGDAAVYGSPLQMRTDRTGGLVVSHYTDANGAMFRVAANGDKSVLPIPYGSIFDVAADGTVWFVRNGSLFVATQNGVVSSVATLGNSAAAVDGPLGASPLGPVTLIAAGKDKVYLLVEEATANVTGTPSPVAFKRSLRELTRSSQISGGWVVKTLPLWADVQTVDVISSIRVSSTDQLFVLANEPFKQLLSQQQIFPGGIAYQYRAEAHVRSLDAFNNWTALGGESYAFVASPYYAGLLFDYSLDAKDLAVAPNGDTWVGGAGAIYKVDSGGWQRVASPAQHPSDQVGRDGKLTDATFASASQLVADNAGITFYDGETCQIRRLENGNIATLSGPKLGVPDFTAARFVGQDTQGDLLLSYGNRREEDVAFYVTRGSYLEKFALVRAAIATPSFVPLPVKSLAGTVGSGSCTTATTYRAGPATCNVIGRYVGGVYGLGYWLGIGTQGVLARMGNSLLTGLDRGDGTTVSSTTTWPGILNGDAPSGPSGIHVDGSKLYLFGWMRTDPPVALGRYIELRLYAIDTLSSAVSVVAGATIASNTFNGARVDLSPVIPAGGGGPAFVQHRSDGKFWLSNGKEIWLLDAVGQLKRISGLSTSGGGVDGVGDAASFGLISSMRVLPDNRLLVVDRGAHAVRLVSDDGKVTTVVGKLNTPGTIIVALPAGLDSPVDAFAVGKDVYITTQTSRNLLRASGVL